jgi:hypothetical protein
LAETLKNATDPPLRATKSKQLGLETQRAETLKPASIKTPSARFKISAWFISKTANPPTTNNQSKPQYKHSAKTLNPKQTKKRKFQASCCYNLTYVFSVLIVPNPNHP